MAIEFIGSATGTTSAVLPSHQAGDLILAFAFRSGSNTSPSLPSGWTNIRNDGAKNCSGRLAYRIASNSSTVSGTWSGATVSVFLVYRGVDISDPIGNNNTNTDISTTVNYPDLTLTKPSLVVGFAGHRASNTTLSAPSGMTNRALVTRLGAHDTNGIVSSWSSANTNVGGSNSGWRSYVVQLNIDPNATVALDSIQSESIAQAINSSGGAKKETDSIVLESSGGTFFDVVENNWYAWFFDRFFLIATGDASESIEGISAVSELNQIQALVPVDAGYEVLGLTINSDFGLVSLAGGAVSALSGEQITGQTSQISLIGDANVSVIGQSALSEAQESVATGDAKAQLSGISEQFVLGEVSATTVIPVSVTTVLRGITATSSVFSVKANAVNDEVLRLSGNPRRYSVQIENANLNLRGITAKMSTSGLNADGTTVISNVVSLNVISATTNVANVTADGILDISDEEITILLMAA